MKVKKAEKVKWMTSVKCTGCRGEIQEISPDDIVHHISDEEALAQHYKVDVVGNFWVQCPDCFTRNKINQKNIPVIVQEEIKHRR
jgi:hypothetical protein